MTPLGPGVPPAAGEGSHPAPPPVPLLERPRFAGLLYSGLSVLWMGKSGLHPSDTVSDVGDPLHLAYILAWNAHQFVTSPFHLFDANSFYPWRQSLSFADHLVPESIMVAPVQWATGNPVLGYNVAVFLGLVMSAWFMRWLILETTGNGKAALLSGLVYAFNGFTLVEANRVQVIHLQWWPVALVFLGRFAAEPLFKWAMGFGAALALQGLSGSYYLAFSALVAPFWLVLAFAGSAKRPTFRAARDLAAAALLAAIPTVLLIVPYLLRGLPRSRVSGGVNLLTYLAPAPGSLWSSVLAIDPLGREFKGLFGLALMAMGLLALLRTRPGWARALGLIALVTALAGVTFSLGDQMSLGRSSLGPGPQRILLRYLPLEGLRHTPRFNALAVLGGAILAGLGAARLLGRSKAAEAALVALGVLLPLEQWSDTGYGVTLPKARELRAIYQNVPAGPLVDLPLYPMTQRRYWAAYPFLSTFHWNPVPIGRTSFYPPGHEFLAWLLGSFPDARSVAVLSQLGVKTVVVHPRVWPAGERQRRMDRIGEFPALSRLHLPPPEIAPNRLELGDESYFQVAPVFEGPPLCAPADEVAADALRVYPAPDEASEAGLELVVDRDPATRWSSGRDQSGSYGFQVRLKPDQQLSAVAIDTPADRFPRVWPLVEARASTGEWETIPSEFSPQTAWEILRSQLDGSRTLRMIVRFKTREVRAFRLIFAAHAAAPAPGFEVAELRAYRECRF